MSFRALVSATCLALFTVSCTLATEPIDNQPPAKNWLSHVRTDHPRIFLNAETLPTIRKYAHTVEKDYYARVKRTVASIPLQPDTDHCEGNRGANNRYGIYAQQAAFVWLLDGDTDALEKARNYLLEGVAFYNRRSSQRRAVQWYSAGRVCSMTAYDWIYDQLTPDQRETVAKGFVKHYKDALSGNRLRRQNRSDHKTGFYGPTNMAWYIGLTFYRDGIVDADALKLLRQGYDEHIRLLDYRRKAAGVDGGTTTIALSYGLGMYPWSEFNFMHSYYSATGLKMEDSYDHLSLFASWVMWNRLPGHHRFGLGDGSPGGKFYDGFLDMHMLNATHFYAERYPDRAEKSMYVRDKLLTSREHDNYWWPVAPFLVTRCAELPKPKGPDASWPLAKNFRNLGVVHMRSSWDEDATCAMYFSGGRVNSHRHYDQGHFAVFSGEHLTGNSGHYGPRERNEHLTEYFYRTVAANSVLIRADDQHDRPPKVWGGPAKTLDGGQYEHAGKQIGFSTDEHFSYASTDMTDCYDKRKCRLATRQFVFVYPDTFVIFDRIETQKPKRNVESKFEKAWLLHSVEKPILTENESELRIAIECENKTLQTAVLLPENAKAELVGGPGREFYSAGANRPQVGKKVEAAGSWRVEVTPAQQQQYDNFLTVLRVRPKGAEPIKAKLVKDGKQLGAEVPGKDGQTVQVFFNRRSVVSGKILITDKDGKLIVEQRLTDRVQ